MVPTSDNLGAKIYLDLSAVFRLMETHDLSVGVNNIFDKEPPLVGASISTGGYYDPLGRYLYADLTLRW